MPNFVWDEPDDGDPLSGSNQQGPDIERERLRAVLAFPEVIESGDSFERPRRVQGPEPKRPVAPDDSVAAGDEVSRRIDQLATRMEALAGLVESLSDRVDHSVSRAGRLTPRQRRGMDVQYEPSLQMEGEELDRLRAVIGFPDAVDERLAPRQRRGTSSSGPVGLGHGKERAHDLEEMLVRGLARYQTVSAELGDLLEVIDRKLDKLLGR